MTYQADPQRGASDAERPVRLLGGIASVFLLSIVAVFLKLADTVDRSRIERRVTHAHERSRSGAAAPKPSPKPWTATMSARTIDTPAIPRFTDETMSTLRAS